MDGDMTAALFDDAVTGAPPSKSICRKWNSRRAFPFNLSACTGNSIVHEGVLNPGVKHLQKPFTPSALDCKLREVLDQPGAP